MREIIANDAIGNNLYIERDYDVNFVTKKLMKMVSTFIN